MTGAPGLHSGGPHTKYVVLVPGSMGSILTTPDKEEVWPPTVIEALGRYGRTDKLLRDDLEVGGVIHKVARSGRRTPGG